MRASKRGEKHREIENCKIYMGENDRAVSENKKIVFLCLICIFKYCNIYLISWNYSKFVL